MKLQMRMFAMFSLLFTAGFLFLLSFTNGAVSRSSHQMVESFSDQSFSFKAQEVGQWLSQRVTELRMIAGTEPLQNGRIGETIPYIGRLNKNVGTQYGNEWGTFAVGYTDGIGWVSENMYIDVSERDYFKEAMKGRKEYVLSKPVKSKTDHADISLICYPLRDRDGQVYGFLNAAISLEKLSKIVAELDFYQGESWIMDREGTVYTGEGMHGAARGSMIELPADGELPESEAEDAPAVYRISQAGRTIFYTAIPYTDSWYLCTSIQDNVLMQDTRQLLVRLTAVFLTVMALLFLFTYFMASSITRPVHSLEEAMLAMEKGNWEVNPKEKGQDEIAHMTRVFINMKSRLRSMMEQIARDEKEKRTAELRVLQAQINPHFLYNTLDTLLYKAYETDNQEMITILESLSAFFRISLSRGREIIPLEKELEHVESYLKIQKIRFQDVLQYEIQTEVSDSFSVLKLILQPLAENAIQHGIKPKLKPGNVKIHAWQEQQTLYLEVSDDGAGMSRQQLTELREELEKRVPRKSYGLINVSNRLKLLYGERVKIFLDSAEGEGTVVRIEISDLSVRKEGVPGDD